MRKLFPFMFVLAIVAVSNFYPLYANTENPLIDRHLDAFDELVLTGVFNVELKTGNDERIVVEADEDYLAFL